MNRNAVRNRTVLCASILALSAATPALADRDGDRGRSERSGYRDHGRGYDRHRETPRVVYFPAPVCRPVPVCAPAPVCIPAPVCRPVPVCRPAPVCAPVPVCRPVPVCAPVPVVQTYTPWCFGGIRLVINF